MVSGSGQTPRCLRRADSGMPHDELTPRSDSSHSPPLDTTGGTSVSHCGASSNSTSSNSEETSSSGVHSNASNASNGSSQRRANSVDDLTNEPREEPSWRSCSLQRGTQPPTAASCRQWHAAPSNNPGRVIYNGGEIAAAPTPPAILESATEATVVIRRRNSRPKEQSGEEPFGRSTNMRMTSFTEGQPSSATLPHYPTQPAAAIYPHCSTMPLPHGSSHSAAAPMSGSCGSVPAPRVVLEQSGSLHTTLPSGARLLHPQPTPAFVKRFPSVQQPWPVLPGAHHTFPNALNGVLGHHHADRDSANFSMASSGDSDTCLPH